VTSEELQDRPPAPSQSQHTKLGDGTEFDLVRRMLARWNAAAQGIGDDAAIIQIDRGSMIVSTDVSVENVHFRRTWLTPREIGYRAAAAALSDLAAMAAEPVALLVGLTLPDSWRDALDEIADGIGEAADGASAKIVAGDLSEGRDLSLAITVIGNTDRPLRRSGARAGDRVYVTGTLGGVGAALRALLEGKTPGREDRTRFAHPVPRVREALWLAGRGATAAIDISDGLVADLAHIAAASGVSMSVSLERLPTASGVEPRAAAGSGEEYEIVVTSSQRIDAEAFTREFGIPFTEIGAVEAGQAVVRVFDRGAPVPTPPGYLHFRK
jgi:thiamine-monophosphate kinase